MCLTWVFTFILDNEVTDVDIVSSPSVLPPLPSQIEGIMKELN